MIIKLMMIDIHSHEMEILQLRRAQKGGEGGSEEIKSATYKIIKDLL